MGHAVEPSVRRMRSAAVSDNGFEHVAAHRRRPARLGSFAGAWCAALALWGCGGPPSGPPRADPIAIVAAGLTPDVLDEMVLVPAGPFRQGCWRSDVDCPWWERPAHTTWLPSYYIDRHLVTIAHWLRCVSDGACHLLPDDLSTYCLTLPEDGPKRPVTCVSWYDAQTYCAWAGKRLCTEAEWEKAARGPQSRLYPWGDDPPDCTRAVFCPASVGCGYDVYVDMGRWACGEGLPAPVGSRPAGASPYGVLDMAGEVWEWVADWYDPTGYSARPTIDPHGPATGIAKVVKGGSFVFGAWWLRSSVRGGIEPSYRAGSHGFRCCADAP